MEETVLFSLIAGVVLSQSGEMITDSPEKVLRRISDLAQFAVFEPVCEHGFEQWMFR